MGLCFLLSLLSHLLSTVLWFPSGILLWPMVILLIHTPQFSWSLKGHPAYKTQCQLAGPDRLPPSWRWRSCMMGDQKKKIKKNVCSSSNSTLKNWCWYSSRHFSVICYNAFCLHFTLEVPGLWEKRKATFFVQMSNSLLYRTQGRRLNYLPVQTQPVNNFS